MVFRLACTSWDTMLEHGRKSQTDVAIWNTFRVPFGFSVNTGLREIPYAGGHVTRTTAWQDCLSLTPRDNVARRASLFEEALEERLIELF